MVKLHITLHYMQKKLYLNGTKLLFFQQIQSKRKY